MQQAVQLIAELERKLGDKPPPHLDQPYSLQAEERRQAARSEKKAKKNKGRRGRIRTQDKIDKAADHRQWLRIHFLPANPERASTSVEAYGSLHVRFPVVAVEVRFDACLPRVVS